MASTDRYAWPTPEESDAPDVPEDMADLADAVEETVASIDDRLTTLTGLSNSVMQFTALARVSSNMQTIPNGVWTPISWDAQQYNLPKATPGFVAASPTRITIISTGLFRVSGFAGIELNSQGSRGLAIRVNGNASYTAISSGEGLLGIPWYGNVTVEARFNANDFIELCLRQTSGADRLMDAVYPRFSAQQVL